MVATAATRAVAKPSAELQRQSQQVELLRKRDAQRSIVEIFTEVQKH